MQRLLEIRKNRMASMNDETFNSYINVETIRTEIDLSKNIFKKYNWPVIDVTRKSVEETAASIIKILDILNSR